MSLPGEIESKELKGIVLASGLVTEEQYDDAASSARDLERNVADVLVFRGLLSDEALGQLMADYYGVEFVHLSRTQIPYEILTIVPEKLATNYKIVPFGMDDKSLKLAMVDPGDFEALEFVRRHTGLKTVPYYANSKDVVQKLGKYKRDIKENFQGDIKDNLDKAEVTEEDLEKAAAELPVIKIFDTILGYAVAEGASDVHIETQDENVIVRFRIDGVLRDIVKHPRGIEKALVARIKILSNLKIDEHRVPQDGRYKFVMNDEVVALRISIIPGFYGENVVMRLLHESQRPLSLEELGLTGSGLEVVGANIRKPHGMVLVTGPTGSGKTTTLYSILNILNTVGVKICTIEDPIEYGMHRVTQIQVKEKTGLTFAAGLRSLLRHDPDIIMVGEIRDKETAEIAVHSALTGHLVLSTLHTNTAAGAIPRLLDMGIEDFLLASTLNVVVAQRLVRKINPRAVEEYQPETEMLQRFEKLFGVSLEGQHFYKGKEEEGLKPFEGRIGLFEVLEVTEEIRSLIVKKATSDELAKAAVEHGMITMLSDGVNKISSGVTTINEVVRVVQDS